VTDLERYLVRIYKYSIHQQKNAVYVNSESLDRLNEFHILLKQFEQLLNIVKSVFSDKSSLKSPRLLSLVTLNSEGEDSMYLSGRKKKRSSGVVKVKPLDLDGDSDEEKKPARISLGGA